MKKKLCHTTIILTDTVHSHCFRTSVAKKIIIFWDTAVQSQKLTVSEMITASIIRAMRNPSL
jgi:hypothetical protein